MRELVEYDAEVRDLRGRRCARLLAERGDVLARAGRLVDLVNRGRECPDACGGQRVDVAGPTGKIAFSGRLFDEHDPSWLPGGEPSSAPTT